MKFKMFFLLIFMMSFWFRTSAQQVSTLVSDTAREFAAMHWHADGRIYAVDYFNGNLYQVYLDGTVETLVTGFSALSGGGFDNAGNFYFSAINDGDIYRLNSDNSYTLIGGGFNQPVAFLADTLDNDLAYITEFGNSKVTKLSLSTGQTTPFISGMGIDGPDALFYDGHGNMIVSNWNNHKIHKISPDGSVSLLAEIQQIGKMGYAIQVGESLYVPSFTGKKVYRVNMDGTSEVIAGTGLLGYNDGAGDAATFYRPNGTCQNAAGDTILISDHQRIRVLTNFEPVINSIEENDPLALQIAPNPVTDALQFSVRNLLQATTRWEIFSMDGKRMKSGVLTDVERMGDTLRIDLPDFADGYYIIQFSNALQQAVSHQFLVGKH